ncbi:MAG: 16S rRNA (cytidine(1402)-2'-O)-methyltransferase [Bacilli bacterium]|jgi:16S rRNA (cytidine1402-2'-O)-methyltransferase|nr:16S rRNA (cytidine(1402)-2'-O)-methyltransferase [Bacilli bacterium]MCH4229093.1 16S rRNA (cytidine(1402)-2'-O)-methyltransferase [Bacilli bacterium]MCI2055413.1 16S rRNA (cytidine(1402)-2'-O)-methyltransferase [Bacilli bacterium]
MVERELNYEGKRPLLYLVATPIGNLSEFSPRAISTLKEMDYIACEDTRNSGILLKYFEIDKPLISCHEHNEEEASEKIISLLLSGKKVAYMSDAGYPTLSDPGERLSEKAIKNGIKIAVINGPSALLCALSGSGLNDEHFLFYGFLPSKPSLRKKELKDLVGFKNTIVFYESPHRIKDTLDDLSSILGGDRRACLCRELTKTHEEYIRDTLKGLDELDASTLIGEMVIVVEGNKSPQKALSDEDIIVLLKDALTEMTPKDAISSVYKEHGLNKKRVYDLYLKNLK